MNLFKFIVTMRRTSEFLSFIYGLVCSSVLHVFACHTKNELSNMALHVFYNSSEEKEL